MILDGRTTAGVRQEIKRQIREYGGFSIFWITANRRRAKQATLMVEEGVIEVMPVQFPWSDAVVIDDDMDATLKTNTAEVKDE